MWIEIVIILDTFDLWLELKLKLKLEWDLNIIKELELDFEELECFFIFFGNWKRSEISFNQVDRREVVHESNSLFGFVELSPGSRNLLKLFLTKKRKDPSSIAVRVRWIPSPCRRKFKINILLRNVDNGWKILWKFCSLVEIYVGVAATTWPRNFTWTTTKQGMIKLEMTKLAITWSNYNIWDREAKNGQVQLIWYPSMPVE